MKNSTKWEFAAISILISAGIVYLRLIADYPPVFIEITNNVIKVVGEMISALGLFEVVLFFQNIPGVVMLFVMSVFQILFGLLLIWWFRHFMEQGVMILVKKPVDVVKAGLSLYLGCVATMFVFLYSIVGIPFSFGILFFMNIVSSIGFIPLAVYIGWLVGEKIKYRRQIQVYYMIGCFVMMVCESVFGVGIAFLFFIFPVLSIGTAYYMFLDRFYIRISIPVEFSQNAEKESFDREKIRNIIKKGCENEKKDENQSAEDTDEFR